MFNFYCHLCNIVICVFTIHKTDALRVSTLFSFGLHESVWQQLRKSYYQRSTNNRSIVELNWFFLEDGSLHSLSYSPSVEYLLSESYWVFFFPTFICSSFRVKMHVLWITHFSLSFLHSLSHCFLTTQNVNLFGLESIRRCVPQFVL